MAQKTHYVKTKPKYFNLVKKGKKNFEVRFNDRGYKVGDRLVLEEFNTNTAEYTGNAFVRIITYILKDFEGLKEGFVVLELEKIKDI